MYLFLALITIVSGQKYINNQAIVSFSANQSFVYWYTSPNPVSIYTVPTNGTNGYAISDFSNPNSSSYKGILAQTISIFHPLGYLVGKSDSLYVKYPDNYNLDSYYPARVYTYENTVNQMIVVETDDNSSQGNLVLIENDDFGNSFASAYPIQLGVGVNEFAEVMAKIDYSGDYDYFVISIRDTVNPNAVYTANIWTDQPKGAADMLNTWCWLYDSAGNQVANNDDARIDFVGCRIQYNFQANKNYYFSVASVSAYLLGKYLVRFSMTFYTKSTLFTRTATYSTIGYTTTLGGTPTPALTSYQLVSPSLYNAITYACPGNCPVLSGIKVIEMTCLPNDACTEQRPSTTVACTETCAPLTQQPPTTSKKFRPVTSTTITSTTTAMNMTSTTATTYTTEQTTQQLHFTTINPEPQQQPSSGVGQQTYLIIGLSVAFIAIVLIWAVFCLRPPKPKFATLSETQAQAVTDQVSQTMMAAPMGMPLNMSVMGGMPMNMSVMGGMPMNMSVMGGMPMNMSVMGGYPAMPYMQMPMQYGMPMQQVPVQPSQAQPAAEEKKE